MLDSRLDVKEMSRLTGKKIAAHYRAGGPPGGGSASAEHYLIYKNQVIGDGWTPKKVFVMYKKKVPTSPRYHIDGRYRIRINDGRRGPEPVLDRILGWRSPYDPYTMIMTLFDATKKREAFENTLNRIITSLLSPKSKKDIVKLANQLSTVKQRADNTQEELQNDTPNSHETFDKSFLPEMIKLAKQNNHELIYLAVKLQVATKNTKKATRNARSLRNYNRNLEKYLRIQGCGFYSFLDHPGIKSDHFYDYGHIKDSKWYTREILYPVLKEKF